MYSFDIILQVSHKFFDLINFLILGKNSKLLQKFCKNGKLLRKFYKCSCKDSCKFSGY